MAIVGIGTDLIEIQRIEEALLRFGDRFVARILGPQEQHVYHARSAKRARRGVSYLATRFAAKEAISKALGLGLRHPMSWRAVEILNGPNGAPMVVAHGALFDFMNARKLQVHISITDERSMASAHAIAEERP